MSTATAASMKDVEMDAMEENTLTDLQKAHKVIRKNMLWAMGLGAVPVPIVDIVSVAGFQAKALKELSDLYDIPYTKHAVKNTLGVLFSGLGAVYLGYPLAGALAGSALKSIPFVGPVVSFTTVPIVAGALTYATGKVFVQHFESGGTFLTFNPKKVRDYYREQFQEGMKVASGMNEAKDAKESDAKKGAASK